jgi:hypothetical protein
MPRHDFSHPPKRRLDTRPVFLKRGSRRNPKDMDDGGVPADPRKPKGLSGGSAAQMNFEED